VETSAKFAWPFVSKTHSIPYITIWTTWAFHWKQRLLGIRIYLLNIKCHFFHRLFQTGWIWENILKFYALRCSFIYIFFFFWREEMPCNKLNWLRANTFYWLILKETFCVAWSKEFLLDSLSFIACFGSGLINVVLWLWNSVVKTFQQVSSLCLSFYHKADRKHPPYSYDCVVWTRIFEQCFSVITQFLEVFRVSILTILITRIKLIS
jgi:hypothetical protein